MVRWTASGMDKEAPKHLHTRADRVLPFTHYPGWLRKKLLSTGKIRVCHDSQCHIQEERRDKMGD